ncbi:phosphoribosyl-ATP diphosphatase [Ostreibacterium oceani]|uniref:Phosphoribosyl-ATP pyrophosphatase n=1 Tax=Ostreibacterium oceani TaxID=2654998 RepID=A0A6N7EVE0_9GAMM|nr:phosphoribosyl-ATP diphosphatase [Ostreibacterium oceani]MPV85565.1 phosphoribosyl-ATP diphosphatase [Ostreibacterium oceani]
MHTIFSTLESLIADRLQAAPEASYVASLNAKGLDAILKKIGEESSEVIIAAKNASHDEIVYEACDLIFHLFILLKQQNIPLSDIEKELTRRLGVSGLTEKANRNTN